MRLYLMPGLGLELKGCDHRPRIDLRDLSVHFELGVFFCEHLCQQLQFFGIDRLLFIRTMQQTAGR